MMHTTVNHTDDIEDFALDNFAVGETEEIGVIIVAESDIVHEPAAEASRHPVLEKLIAEDAANAASARGVHQDHATQKLPLVATPTRSIAPEIYSVDKPSRHIVDLRIIKRNKYPHRGTMQRPAPRKQYLAGFVRTLIRSQVRPHPETHNIPVAVPREPVVAPIEHWQPSFSSLVVFSGMLMLFLLLIPAFHLITDASSVRDLISQQSLAAFTKVKAGVSGLSSNNVDSAEQSFREAQADFQVIGQRLQDYSTALTTVATVLPSQKSKIVIVQSIGTMGEAITTIGQIMSDPKGYSSSSSGIASLRIQLASISDSLQRVSPAIKDLNERDVPERFRPVVASLKSNNGALFSDVQHFISLLDVAAHITGADRFARYLFVFQNSRELRPTGGFIGSYALVDFANGKVSHVEFPGAGSYDLSGSLKKNIIPPRPISILNQRWFFWDANWWPDFPTSAKKLLWFYDQSGGPTVDGVIAVNSNFMVDLLRATGPLVAPDTRTSITADNFYSLIQNEVEGTYDKALNQPKKILKDIMPGMIDRLAKPENFKSLLTTVTHSLVQKDIQIYLSDADYQKRIKDLGWDGSLRDAERDFLYVVSTNIAGGKSDGSIYETIDHAATIKSSGEIEVTTTITKENRADPADLQGYFNNVDYTRVYVPLGSTLIKAQGFEAPPPELFKQPQADQEHDADLDRLTGPVTIDQVSGTEMTTELNHTVFANWMQVKPGQHTTASVTYRLPFRITTSPQQGINWFTSFSNAFNEVDGYSLVVQRQSGRYNTLFNSTVHVESPLTVVWSDAVDQAAAGYANQIYSFGTNLDHDTYYALLLARESQP